MLERIVNAETLLEVYGAWPAFHDAEVVRVRLDRGDQLDAPRLELDILAFAMPASVTPHGRDVSEQLVTLRFDDVSESELRGFNAQNVLFSLDLEDLSALDDPRTAWRVSLPSSWGLGGEFVCGVISVVDVVPRDASIGS